MADEEEKKEEESQEEGQEKKSNKLMMIIIIVVLLLIIVIGAVVTILLLSDDQEDVVEKEPVAKTKAVKPKKRVSSISDEELRKLSEIGPLYPLDTFTVNLKSDSGRRYLKVTMDLELSGPELTPELDAKTAVIRDRIIRILTSKTLEEVSSRKGKNKLSSQIVDSLNMMLDDGEIQGVYFTEFVIQ